jgi:hypothetical protein
MLPSNRSRSPYEDGTKPMTVQICAMTLFDKSTLARFGLPRTLPD